MPMAPGHELAQHSTPGGAPAVGGQTSGCQHVAADGAASRLSYPDNTLSCCCLALLATHSQQHYHSTSCQADFRCQMCEKISGRQVCKPRAFSTAGRGLPRSARACDVSTENR